MKEVRQRIKDYIEERGWRVFEKPADIAKSVSIESAELLEMFQWKDHTPEEIKADQKLRDDIGKELADVFIYCIEMAIALDLDIEEIINAKLDHNEKKYPADVVKGDQEEYLKIKQEYRNK